MQIRRNCFKELETVVPQSHQSLRVIYRLRSRLCPLEFPAPLYGEISVISKIMRV